LSFVFSRDTHQSRRVHYIRHDHIPDGDIRRHQTPGGDVHGLQIPDGTHGDQTPDGTRHDHTHHLGHHCLDGMGKREALNVEPTVMIAAAAAKPMTVLRIVLTPLLLEKPQP